jgi:hypothetical protein
MRQRNVFAWSSIALDLDTQEGGTAAAIVQFVLGQRKQLLGFERLTGSAATTLLLDRIERMLFFIVFQQVCVISH